jgi:hypothetical protein
VIRVELNHRARRLVDGIEAVVHRTAVESVDLNQRLFELFLRNLAVAIRVEEAEEIERNAVNALEKVPSASGGQWGSSDDGNSSRRAGDKTHVRFDASALEEGSLDDGDNVAHKTVIILQQQRA